MITQNLNNKAKYINNHFNIQKQFFKVFHYENLFSIGLTMSYSLYYTNVRSRSVSVIYIYSRNV